jgi:hypothetical protein
VSRARAAPLPDEPLAILQAALLQAALDHTALPGGATVSLPDRDRLPQDEPAPLADANLARGLRERLPPDVRIVGTDAPAPDVAFLRFQPATADDSGSVWLTLELLLPPPRPGEEPTPLGGVQVAVRFVDGDWQIIEAPRAFGN